MNTIASHRLPWKIIARQCQRHDYLLVQVGNSYKIWSISWYADNTEIDIEDQNNYLSKKGMKTDTNYYSEQKESSEREFHSGYALEYSRK
jgi:hypothetical protein